MTYIGTSVFRGYSFAQEYYGMTRAEIVNKVLDGEIQINMFYGNSHNGHWNNEGRFVEEYVDN